VLDLDETLVHSKLTPDGGYDYKVCVNFNTIYGKKRPGLTTFLELASEHYEIVVFSASIREYCQAVIKQIDKAGYISHWLGREECTLHNDVYTKDLSRLGRNLQDTVLVDDNPDAYLFNPSNALPICSWYDCQMDTQLEEVWNLLHMIALREESVTTVLGDLDVELNWNRQATITMGTDTSIPR